MPNYRRIKTPGGTFFFTVNLLERRKRLLVEHIDIHRAAFRLAKHRRPFRIIAIVVLPDHLHCIWQRRFWERVIQNDADLNAHIEYIHHNPVKHQLVSVAIDWPYSSLKQAA